MVGSSHAPGGREARSLTLAGGDRQLSDFSVTSLYRRVARVDTGRQRLIVDQIAQEVRTRDAEGICARLFEGSPPRVRRGANTETELWDYKADVPKTPEAWATIARHSLAFHNHRGGVIVFGVRD
jgi:hypothetical protein